MIAYLDSSVLLRVILGQPNQLTEWKKIRDGIASALLEPECLRTIDRARVTGRMSFDEALRRREAAARAIEELEVLDLTPIILRRAAQPNAVPLGVLDALHLATAELWREAHSDELLFATHDRVLALAARTSGFRIIGA